jgi:hypothetical protein
MLNYTRSAVLKQEFPIVPAWTENFSDHIQS